ncbi:MAG: nitroreductase family protein [Muribaculaceae bacterium]|nr:nitroreductase family protein [Muribaculaceae bacterium]
MTINPYYTERRTVRVYKNCPVSDKIISDIAEAASHAPSTGNMQLYSLVVTRDKDNLAKLTPCHFNQPASTNAPVILTFCADLNRFEHWCRINDAKPGFENLQSLMSAILDVTIFAQQFVTIAEQNGLGCCYLGTTTYNAEEIANALDLPDRVIPIISLSLGYPDDDATKTPRLPVDAFLHFEKYNRHSDDIINNLYKVIEEQPDNARYIAENDKDNLAQVFTDVRYPRSNNELFSDKFIDYIRRQQFMK